MDKDIKLYSVMIFSPAAIKELPDTIETVLLDAKNQLTKWAEEHKDHKKYRITIKMTGL